MSQSASPVNWTKLPPLLKVPKVMEITGLGEYAVRGAIERGELPALRFGRKILIPTDRLRRLIVNGELMEAPPAAPTLLLVDGVGRRGQR